jgi:hypothetical protein
MDVTAGMGSIDFTATARRLGMVSAVGLVVLGAAYAVTLASGSSATRACFCRDGVT